MIKKIIFALFGLVVLGIAVIAVLAMIAPKQIAVSREATINKPKDQVFAYLKMLKNQDDWGPWVKKDPAIKLTKKGTDGTAGYIAAWESELGDVGVGEQEIKKITEGERIDTELRFKKPWEVTNQAYITTTAAGENQTKVKWGFEGDMPIPFNIMMLIMDMDKEVGKDFDAGLQNLKGILEKQ